jgi:small subunit ribosomal protein S15
MISLLCYNFELYYLGVKALDTEKKAVIMKSYAIRENDTGSADVQIAVLTERINQLSGHLKEHTHDQHTRRSLLRLIGRRRRLLAYLSREDINRYRTLIGKLGLRK